MTVTFEITDTCAICGCRVRGFSVRTVRINKRSMRTTDRAGIGFCLPCPECGGGWAPDVSSTYRLEGPSAAKVRLYRERKWPELRREVTL